MVLIYCGSGFAPSFVTAVAVAGPGASGCCSWEHDMSLVMGGVRRIMDLNFGTILGSGPTDEIRAPVVRELDLTCRPTRSSAAQGPSR